MTSQVSNNNYNYNNYNNAAPGYNGPAPINNNNDPYSYHSSYPQHNQNQYQQNQYQQPPPYQQNQYQNDQYQHNEYQHNEYQQNQNQYQQPPPYQQQQQYGQKQQYGAPAAPFNFNMLCSYPFVSVKQKVEQMEVITGFETGNKYAVVDPSGNMIMKCSEKSSTLAKLALGAGRSMDIKITDASGAPLMCITRPFKLWHKNVTITDGSGRSMGSVLKKFAVGKTIFHLMDPSDNILFTIRGGAFINIGKSRTFTITNSQGTEVGSIKKEWAGLMKEAFTDADNFTIQFPAGSSGDTRALLVAVTLFIDLSHFEQ